MTGHRLLADLRGWPPKCVFATWVVVLTLLLTGCGGSTPEASSHPSPATTAPRYVPPADPALAQAVTAYHRYVDSQLAALVTTTTAFAHAVQNGQFRAARLLYPRARVHYERIEPAAEIWGTLDLAIDGRANDFVPASRFSGFHRLEQVLWAEPPAAARLSPAGGATVDVVASTLVANVRRVQRLAASTSYTILELTSGATELLNEIESTKITGEEDRYSHLDLVDIDANVTGCLQIITLLSPYLRAHSPQLLQTITMRGALVLAALRRLHADPGADATGYPSYAELDSEQRRALSNDVEALAQPVSLTTSATSR